jgi:chaperonin GroEL
MRGGIVPGAGATLLRASRYSGADEGGDAALGAKVFATALEAPLRQLAANAGLDGAVAVQRVRAAADHHGLDLQTNRIVDLMDARIFDPVDVVCTTVKIATSMAAIALLTEGIVAAHPVRVPRRPGHGHGHDHDHENGNGHHHPNAQLLRAAR